MKIIIRSREKIEEMAKKPFSVKTAIISITDQGWPFAQLREKPDYLHQVEFDDVDYDVFDDEGCSSEKDMMETEIKYNMLSRKQVKEIAEFYRNICDKADVLICQCEHGQSRSAAVAAAILEYRSGRGIKVFAHKDYYPNKFVFNRVLEELKTEG